LQDWACLQAGFEHKGSRSLTAKILR
jgi:hypothetical protein